MPGPVSCVQSSALELSLAPGVVVASGALARGVGDCAKTAGWLGVAVEALPADWTAPTDDIRSKPVIRIEEMEVGLLSFARISSAAKASVFYI